MSLGTNRLGKIGNKLSDNIIKEPLHDDSLRNTVILCHIEKDRPNESLKQSKLDRTNSNNDYMRVESL